MIPAEKNRLVAKAWLKAFNAHALEDILSLYHPDAVHYSPKLKMRQPETMGLIKGRIAMHAWWKDSFDRLPGLQYVEQRLTADEHCVFMEYLRKNPGEEDMHVAEVLEIQDGLIVASRVYHG